MSGRPAKPLSDPVAEKRRKRHCDYMRGKYYKNGKAVIPKKEYGKNGEKYSSGINFDSLPDKPVCNVIAIYTSKRPFVESQRADETDWVNNITAKLDCVYRSTSRSAMVKP